MLKLNIVSSKKIGQPDYGSLGATVGVEVELDSSLVSNPDALIARTRGLFDVARRAVDEELRNGRTSTPQPPNGNGTSNASTNGNGNGQRAATASQLRAIRAIAKRLGHDADAAAVEVVGVHLDDITLPQASQLIDELKSRQTTGGAR